MIPQDMDITLFGNNLQDCCLAGKHWSYVGENNMVTNLNKCKIGHHIIEWITVLCSADNISNNLFSDIHGAQG